MAENKKFNTVQKEISYIYTSPDFLCYRGMTKQTDLPYHLGFVDNRLCLNCSASGTVVILPQHHSLKTSHPNELILGSNIFK